MSVKLTAWLVEDMVSIQLLDLSSAYLQFQVKTVQVCESRKQEVELALQAVSGHSVEEEREGGVAGECDQEAGGGGQLLPQEMEEGEEGLQFRHHGHSQGGERQLDSSCCRSPAQTQAGEYCLILGG